MGGVNQVQINNRAGMTFAAALRSILRSDPDVVMVGEIRDGETAKISIEAALTGHLVLSSLHTNDAPGALTRLNEMGVEPFLTGAAVSGVLAQRLARKLCTHCCEMYSPSVEEMIAARVSPDVAASVDGMAFYRKRGCPRCNQTGYRGRIGIFQLLEMTEDLASLAAKKGTREEIERAALDTGMRTIWDDGLAKVAAGLTSIEELARSTAPAACPRTTGRSSPSATCRPRRALRTRTSSRSPTSTATDGRTSWRRAASGIPGRSTAPSCS